jgi:hypothetical protein
MIHRRAVLITVAAAVVCVVAASTSCVANSTGTAPPPTDTVCTRGAIVAGDSLSATFDAANGCRIVDIFSAETTFANSYSLALKTGQGYLLTMGTTDSNPYLHSSLELVNAKKKLVAYDVEQWRALAALAFVADSNMNWSVRAATHDTQPGDFGIYFIRMQTCRVPAFLSAPTDSITHADSLTKSDCLMPMSDFNVADSSRVHLYSMNLTAGDTRVVSWSSPVPLTVLIGPTYDTFASLPGSIGADSVAATTGTIQFSPGPAGDYTIIVGTYAYSATTVPYTITIGTNQLVPGVATPFSRNRFHPPGVLRLSTPLSAWRRGQ